VAVRRHGPGAHPVAERASALGEFLDEALRHKAEFLALARARAEHDEHHAVREETAERPVAFHKRHLRARARGGDRGGDAGDAAAGDDEIAALCRDFEEMRKRLKEAGEAQEATSEEIIRMDYLEENVRGLIPAYEELEEKAKKLVNSQGVEPSRKDAGR